MSDSSSNKSSDSDEMIDIQIEESLVRETLMKIDSMNFKEEVLILTFFLILLLIIGSSGIFGPPAILTTSKKANLTKVNSPQRVGLIMNTTSYHRFIEVLFAFERKNTTELQVAQGKWACTSKMYNGLEIIKEIHTDEKKINITAEKGSNTSESFPLFYNELINFKKIQFDFRINLFSPEFSQIILKTRYGSPDHTVFQMYFRTLFSILEIVVLIYAFYRLKKTQFKYWHLEQKLTIPMLILCIIFNNPFYILSASTPSAFLVVSNTIFTLIFSNYLKFFILCLFDSLRFKNRKIGPCFFIPKVTYSLIYLIISLVHSIHQNITSFSGVKSSTSDLVQILDIFLYDFYCFWIIIIIFMSSCQVNVTEDNKFMLYLISGLTAVILLFLVEFILPICNLFTNSSIHFAVSFSVQNLYVLLMTYFHWPYEILQDQNYTDEKSQENEMNVNQQNISPL